MTRLRLALVALVISLGTSGSVAAQDYVDESKAFVQGLADRAIETALADLPMPVAREKIRDVLNDGFAIEGLARFVLGRHWRRASDAEREEYLRLFEDVVVNLSASRFQQYTGQRFEIVTAVEAASGRDDENAAIVRSRFYLSDDSPIRIDWRVANRGDVYKVTDVILEGASLANTYRDEFTSVVRREGIPGLLAKLRQQRDDLANASVE